MDKGKLKNFAGEARRRLISHISARIGFILTHETAEFIEKATLKEKLRSAWENAPDRDEFVERHAYILFNRLIALRFMDVRGYNFVPVVSPRILGGDPGILADARMGLFQPDLPVDTQKISDLLTGKIPTHNPFNEVYKLLFIAACGAFNKTMPFMFEPMNSYTELLLPDDLLSANSIIAFINDNLGVEECQDVEVIGWLYQFYIQEKKDKVFADKKNTANRKKDEIAAITQLFTPNWIVKYMVENGLGKLWMLNNPNSGLVNSMKYYIPTELKNEDVPKIESPEEITILDPCSGSGHTLVYAFDILMKIYEESGYFLKDIPALILTKNLTGLELDNRAASLSGFALMMKAMEHDRSFMSRGIYPKIYSLNDERIIKDWDLNGVKIKESERLKAEYLAGFFKDADMLGSLIDSSFSGRTVQIELFPDFTKKEEFDKWFDAETSDMSSLPEKLVYSSAVYQAMDHKYHFVVTNPPYLPGNSNAVLKSYLEKNYKNSKSDLFAAFIERCVSFTRENGFTGMITQHAWMFLSSFEKLREDLIKKYFIDSMSHLGARAFEEIGGEVVQSTAFVLLATKPEAEQGVYVRLVDYKDAKLKEEKFLEGGDRFSVSQSNFSKIPGSPVAYWVSERIFNLFSKYLHVKYLTDYSGTYHKTSDNDKFLRFYWELCDTNVGIGKSYVYYNKGGEYRKWYGNNQYVVNWKTEAVTYYVNHKTANLFNRNFWFKSGITWTALTSGNFNARYFEEGFISDYKGACIFPKDNKNYEMLAFFNSKVFNFLIKIIAPTMDYNLGQVISIPCCLGTHDFKDISLSSISISRLDWDSRETSWDFQTSPLITAGDSPLLSERYGQYKTFWTEKFYELHRNEEELNRIFIEIYGLQEELTPDVELKDVTILQPEKIITDDNKLEFKTSEVMRQFVSWSVGCMFGRYSLDKPGLILANQGETLQDYLKQIPEPQFTPDDDNIIPVLDDEYFADDIVTRFHRFLQTAFGRENFSLNLRFIEDGLGLPIRRYFVKEFYSDHLRRYKKRPIYWLVSSPGGSFNALIYMHRYNSQTMSKIFNDYLKEFRSKLSARMKDIQDGIFTGNNPVREEENLRKQMKDVDDFILTMTPFAMNPVEIDLDDGVKVNIAKFGGVVKGI